MAPKGIPGVCSQTSRDITSLKASEAALGENEARLCDLLDTVNLGTFMTRTPNGVIRFWSEGCMRLYGWTAAEAVERVSHDLLRTKFPPSLAESEAAVERDGE